MTVEPDMTRIAATIGDASRIRMLMLLMEGRALTAKELALGAGIEPAQHFTQQEWITRKKHSRVVLITVAGGARFSRLGLKLPGHATPASGL